MRGNSRPTSVKHPGVAPSGNNQIPTPNSAQIYTSQRPSTYFDGSYQNQIAPQAFGMNQAVVPLQGQNPNSQFVQHVIYNQGTLIINKDAGPQVQLPQNNYTANPQISKSQTAVNQQTVQGGNQPHGHQKTKSTAAVIQSQNPLLGHNGAPVTSNHHRYPTNVPLIQEATKKINMKPLNPQQIQPPIQDTLNQNQVFSGLQTTQPSHKKTQSMAQSKLAQLLVKTSKKVGQSTQQKQQENTDFKQQSIDQLIQSQIQRKQNNQNSQDPEEQLLRILRDQKTINEHSYQNQGSSGSRESTFTQQFVKHARAATQGSNLTSSYDKAQKSDNYHISSYVIQPTSKQVRPPSSKPVHQENISHQKQKQGNVLSVDKIASNGKVIASGSVVKKASVNKAVTSFIGGQQNPTITSQNHHRVKSDQQYSLKAKELLVAGNAANNVILNQKGKVGKILKNNYVESASDQQAHMLAGVTGHIDKSLNSSMGGHSSFGLAPGQKQVNKTFQQPPTSSKQIQNITNPQINQILVQPNHQKKSSLIVNSVNNTINSGHNQNQRKKTLKENKNRQSTKERFVELQDAYNKLLEKHVNLLHTNKVPTQQLNRQSSGNSSISLNQTANNIQNVQIKTNRIAKFIAGAQQNSGQTYLFTLGADENRPNTFENKQVNSSNELRGLSWDGKQIKSTELESSHEKNYDMKVPPQSSTSSARLIKPQINNQNPLVFIDKNKGYSAVGSNLSSNLVSLTSEARFQEINKASKKDAEKKQFNATPISSGRSSSQFYNQQRHIQQSLNVGDVQKIFQAVPPTFSVQQNLLQQQVDNLARRTFDARHRRSLSNGSNESKSFKFQKNIKGLQSFVVTGQVHPSTAQPTIISNEPATQNFKANLTVGSRKEKQSPNKQQTRQPSDSDRQAIQNLKQNDVRISSEENRYSKSIKQQQSFKRPKSKQSKQNSQNSRQNVEQGFNFQAPIFKQLNSKFKVSTSTHESPSGEQKIEKIAAASFHHPQLSLQVNKGNIKKSQPMVIQENTPPQSPLNETELNQLSEWDKMIKTQNQRPPSIKAPLVQNLVTDEAERVDSKVKKNLHIKNKISVHSDASAVQKKQNNMIQYPDNIAVVKNSQMQFNQQEYSKPHHKRVKSDVVDQYERKVVSIADFVQQTTKGVAQSEALGNSYPPSSGQLSQNSNKKQKQQNASFKQMANQFEKAIELAVKDNRKQKVVNISIEKLEPADDELGIEKLVRQPMQAAQQKQTKSKNEVQNSQNSTELMKSDKYKHILRRAKVTYNGRKNETSHQSQIQTSEIQDQNKVISYENKMIPAPQIFQQREIQNVPQNSINQSTKQTPKQEQRLVTQESMESNLTPKRKIIRKLQHHIVEQFKLTGECPATTVDFYRVGKILGKGAFGKVNLAQQQLTQQLVAIKSINKTHFSEESQSKKVMQEVMILKQTRHRNIIRLFEYFETQKHILFVLELSSGGDLLSYVRKRRQLKEEVAKSVFKQLIEGIKYCHNKKILHRDIKLDNILLTVEGVIKICDFGVSKIVKPGEKMSEQCGTPAYIAPEILLDKGYEGFGVDIWSAGVVLYAMLYGTVPFKANNMSELQKMIIKAKFTLQEGVSKEAKDLLRQLLEKDPLQRISIPNILAHPWMRDAKDTVELFTNAEKNYMRYEFSCQEQGGLPEIDFKNGDPFMEQMLDTCQNSMLKNAETKSIILAPFNSTKSNLEELERCFTLDSEIKEMIQSKSCLKFAPRVREIDKQYEVNNNAELDNGVYHDFNKDEKPAIDKEDSLQSDFRESMNSHKNGGAKSQTELQKLEKMIQKQEVGEYAQTKPQKQSKSELTHLEDIVVQNEPLQIIDEQILNLVTEFGYPVNMIRKYLQKCDLNSATTTYFLLDIQKQSNMADTTQKTK